MPFELDLRVKLCSTELIHNISSYLHHLQGKTTAVCTNGTSGLCSQRISHCQGNTSDSSWVSP